MSTDRLWPAVSAALPPELRGWAQRLADGAPYAPPIRSRVRLRRPAGRTLHAPRFRVELWAHALPFLHVDFCVPVPRAADVLDLLQRLPIRLALVRPHWIHQSVVRATVYAGWHPEDIGDDASTEPVAAGHVYAYAGFPGYDDWRSGR